MTLLARLKPYNERKGHLTRTYMIDGNRFFEERGWYEVPDALGEKLRDLHQEHYDLDSPLLFDVCTSAQAEKLEQQEQQAEARASARRPTTVQGVGATGAALAATGQRVPANLRGPMNNGGGPEGGGDLTTADSLPRPSPSAAARGPVNNGGEGEGGDTTSADVASKSGEMLDPDPDGKEVDDADDGRAVEVGRVGSKSTPPKPRTRR